MILLVECIISCVVFSIFIISSVLKDPVAWINEYPDIIQQRYIDLHPEYQNKEVEGLSLRIIVRKIMACIIFLIILIIMVYMANARTFKEGFLYCYLIWFTVDVFDTIVLDWILMVHWKKVRLPGTKDMDEAYKLLYKQSLNEGLYGCVIGIVIALITGLIISVI